MSDNRGGWRPGSGRPKGSGAGLRRGTETQKLIRQAETHMELPHLWLLRIMHGAPVKVREIVEEEINGVIRTETVERLEYPTLADRIDAAKAAAPYFAPKLSAIAVQPINADDPASMSDEEIDRRIDELADKLGWPRKAPKAKASAKRIGNQQEDEQ